MANNRVKETCSDKAVYYLVTHRHCCWMDLIKDLEKIYSRSSFLRTAPRPSTTAAGAETSFYHHFGINLTRHQEFFLGASMLTHLVYALIRTLTKKLQGNICGQDLTHPRRLSGGIISLFTSVDPLPKHLVIGSEAFVREKLAKFSEK